MVSYKVLKDDYSKEIRIYVPLAALSQRCGVPVATFHLIPLIPLVPVGIADFTEICWEHCEPGEPGWNNWNNWNKYKKGVNHA